MCAQQKLSPKATSPNHDGSLGPITYQVSKFKACRFSLWNWQNVWLWQYSVHIYICVCLYFISTCLQYIYIYICIYCIEVDKSVCIDICIFIYVIQIYICVYSVYIYIITQKCDVKLVLLQASVSRLPKKGLPPNRPPRVWQNIRVRGHAKTMLRYIQSVTVCWMLDAVCTLVSVL